MSQCEKAIKDFMEKYGDSGVSSVLRQIVYVCKNTEKCSIELLPREQKAMSKMADDLQDALEKCHT